MRRFRFSIAGLMGIVLIAAVGTALYRAPMSFRAGPIFLATIAALSLAVVAAIERRGARRAWCLGFAVFGWGHLALAVLARPLPGPSLATSQLLVKLRPILAPSTFSRPAYLWLVKEATSRPTPKTPS